MKIKKNKNLIFGIIIILIILISGIIYLTHKSEKQELTENDKKIKELLKVEENKTEIKIINETKKIENKLNVIKKGFFNPKAKDSNFYHRGEGNLKIINFNNINTIIFEENFKVTNGPDYKLYLVKEFDIETKKQFLKVKDDSYEISNVKNFEGYQTFEIPNNINIDEIKTAIIWCESFSQFITTANLK